MEKITIKNIFQIFILLFFSIFLVKGVLIDPNKLVINRQTIKLERWNAAHNNLKIAVISDIHAGSPFIGIKKIEKIVELTNKENPDIVLFGGDFVTYKVLGGKFISPDKIAGILAKLKPEYGMLAALGNHDCKYSRKKVAKALEQNGIIVLYNDSRELIINEKPLFIAGIADLTTGNPDIPKALSKTKNNSDIIMLSHEPDAFPFVPKSVALTISGHTHGGQVKLPVIGAVVVPSIYKKRFLAGHIHENERDLFVSSGIGTSILPIRYDTTPEIVILTLKNK
jgi:predicted MPP superfamily phosphohydrolase